ncbi:MAG: DUF294 nucleotidyltransferase-like domain-containing protein [Flavobacterium sp.]
MKNSITESIANFLVNFQPFSELTYEELTQVALDIRVLNLEKNKTLFKVNDPLHDYFYVVFSGTIDLSIISDADEITITKCEFGDVFGLRPFFAKNNYMMTAKANDESIVYAIPIATFRPFVANNTNVLEFLLQNFASSAINTNDKKGSLINDTVQYTSKQAEIQFFQSLDYNRNPLLAAPTAIAMNVAQMMADNLFGCAIIHERNLPIGVITDVELRNKIATGKFHITTLASNIMTSPVITVTENLSVAEAQLIMLRHHVSYLCVTSDGTDKTAVKGVISQQDLINAQSNNPGLLIKEIKKCMNSNDLKNLRYKLSEFIRISINKKIPLNHIINIAGEVNITLIKRVIDLSILELGSPPIHFAWLSIGSQGRKEQLLLTEQNSFLVFEDVSESKYREVRDYFLRLSKKVTTALEFIGYNHAPNGYTASNPLYCKSISEWKEYYISWIESPVKKSEETNPIFFDYEMVYGDSKLVENLTETIFEKLDKNKKFFAFLGNETLKKPVPLSFFKHFVLEEDEINKNLFDIKNRAISGLVDAARVLILSYKVKSKNNTFSRFKQLAIEDEKHAEIYLKAAEDFLLLTKFRTLEGLKNGNDGQFINVEDLPKNDKEDLKESFHSMKELEEIIKNRFQLTYFS